LNNHKLSLFKEKFLNRKFLKLKIQRNEPCLYGSGKKYKTCCWEKDIKNRIKRKKRSEAWNLGVQNLRKKPKSSEYWVSTNKVIDEILKISNFLLKLP